MKQIKINEKDNVAVMLEGKLSGHKIALNDIKKGENIIKYGYPIGHAQMAKKQGVTEELKATDMMRWIGLMNNIRACADEIVLNDIVYS